MIMGKGGGEGLVGGERGVKEKSASGCGMVWRGRNG